ASKTVVIQSKRYHIDVKENRRGKFIKITEVSPIGKNRLKMSMSAASDFRSHLESFCEYYVKLPPSDPDNLPEDGMLKSEMVMKENRRYYLDLKENDRGRFLRVSQ
ncbi:transcriptional activator protein Pur-beta-like, partial [Anneissia japonica]|uniref:transcriptional activator protein Pur-beta-like n=1 Tax=Anneissia japonica TaxID=1529436 RepID=UPI00142566A6